jgi:hypothetical protein
MNLILLGVSMPSASVVEKIGFIADDATDGAQTEIAIPAQSNSQLAAIHRQSSNRCCRRCVLRLGSKLFGRLAARKTVTRACVRLTVSSKSRAGRRKVPAKRAVRNLARHPIRQKIQLLI